MCKLALIFGFGNEQYMLDLMDILRHIENPPVFTMKIEHGYVLTCECRAGFAQHCAQWFSGMAGIAIAMK